MKYLFYCIEILLLISSCGLKYTPLETREELTQNRQNIVNQYIRDSYKDSNVIYQSLTFASPTVVKPYYYRQLDSLYEIKYNNEKNGKYDENLEEKIRNQKIVIENSSEKLEYIEHHIYSIQTTDGISNIYFADIKFNNENNILDFKIIQTYEIPSNLIPIFKSYITGESLVYPNYMPSQDELNFIQFFENELEIRPSYEKNNFMITMLNIFQLCRNLKTIETKILLQNFAVIYTEDRQYNTYSDKTIYINGIWDNDVITKYEISISTPEGTYECEFSNFLEPISLVKTQ